MNIFLGLIVLTACTFIGYLLSKKFTKRKKFFSDFNTFNNLLIKEVAFSQTTIAKLVQNFSCSGDFIDCVDNFYKKNNITVKDNYLNADEIEFLTNYLNTIGASDKDSQIKYLDGALKVLDKMLNDSTNDEKRYRNLYIKLGFLFGLMAFIIIL